MMENPEEVLQLLERFTKLKQKEIPRELDDYLGFVARTGDTVYRWAVVKQLIRTKLIYVITDFYVNTPSIADLPQCPNVDPFNYEQMRKTLIDRLDSFNSAPFTVQRICELLTEPRKQYTRIDKFMRAVEKNILVVSTQEPGRRRYDSENGDSLDSIVNGDLEVNVDIEMDNEAFGIESNEIGPHAPVSPSSSLSSATSSLSVTTVIKLSDTEISPEENMIVSKSLTDIQESEKSPEADIAETETHDLNSAGESAIDSEPITTESTMASTNDENSSNHEATSSLEETAPLNGDGEVKEETIVPDAKVDPVPQTADECDGVESVAKVATPEPDSTESVDSSNTDNPQPPALECLSSNNALNKEKSADDYQAVTGVENDDAAEEPTEDDGQPQAKLAKLSSDLDDDKTVDLKETSLSVEPEIITEQNNCEINSDSATNLAESNISADSESSSASSNGTIPNLTEQLAATECPPEAEESTPNEVDNKPSVDEITSEAEPLTEVLPDVHASEELPTEATTVLPSDTIALKPADVNHEAPVVATTDEMETVSSTMVPENEMATDEEESTPKLIDAVVPMAADVPESAKADDNAMDVDESSVEPMDQ
ncbi:serine/threonine-protein phosphatase 4 regulatory subunit 2-like [Malaya genurostris]|uniref:serine/threonine-protein phosphatase 4 regulatory subunit 2-like n=1 Tax=Malaya genurostris TaxID=325434 RepID=UPI0026F3C150|nr:serine/threonine-protein phosphatase 4 regulatory subunit 2-like [Malaya genurostris]